MNRLSVSTLPLVSTFAMLAIRPNARSKTDRLEASSKRYKIPVSSFSMDAICLRPANPQLRSYSPHHGSNCLHMSKLFGRLCQDIGTHQQALPHRRGDNGAIFFQ